MILVAGGTGLLGRHLVQRLVARGLAVRVLSRNASGAEACRGAPVEVVQGDVRDPASLEPAMRGIDTVVSAVHGFTGTSRDSLSRVDRDGNVHLIEAAESVRASFVLMSAIGASADHPMELQRMKYAAEQRLRTSRLSWTIVRATSFLELWLSLLESTARGSGRPLIFGRGNNPINFVSVIDVAALIERVIIAQTARGRVLEIGGPQNLSFNELAAQVQRAAGREVAPRHVPRVGLRIMAVCMRPFRPDLARQARSALLMDEGDLTFDASAIRAEYRDLPSTTVADALVSPIREQAALQPAR